MEKLKYLIQPNGQINEDLIIKRETLYTGTNGKAVERLFLTPNESYIFKPLTNNTQLGNEIWTYEHVLLNLPPFYPRLYDKSLTNRPDRSWLLLEDLGKLEHQFEEDIILGVVEVMAQWHHYPIEKINKSSLKAPKPMIDEMIKDLQSYKATIQKELTSKYGVEEAYFKKFYSHLSQIVLPTELVFSHGDLHPGNFSKVDSRLVILDWEHAHINSPFWDLYHLIDITHPLFPKQVTPSLRDNVLERYLEKIEGAYDDERFKLNYYLFSSIFSLWMLRLILIDLRSGKTSWPEAALQRQLSETATHFVQCVKRL